MTDYKALAERLRKLINASPNEIQRRAEQDIITAADLIAKMAEREPFGYLRQTSSDKNPPHGWAFHFESGDIPIYLAPPTSDLSEIRQVWQEALSCVMVRIPANLPHDDPYRPVNLGWSQCCEYMRGAVEDLMNMETPK